MHKIERNSSKQQSLLCCRACLSTDCRLYDIHEYKVDDAFSRITDTPVSRDLQPQYLCGWCLTLLLKCAAFRAMCVRSQQRFTKLLQWRMDTGSIRRPPLRPFHLTRTKTTIIDCFPTENKITYEREYVHDIKADPEIEHKNKIENLFGFKNEINITHLSSVDNNASAETQRKGSEVMKMVTVAVKNPKDSKMTHASVKKHMVLKIDAVRSGNDDIDAVRSGNDDIDDVRSVDDDIDDIRSVDEENKGELNELEMMTIGADIKQGHDSYDNITLGDSVCVRQVKLVKQGVPSTGRKVNDRRIRRHPTDGYILFDFASFESDYSVKVVLLSKEEELEEIVSRKKSRNYLEAPFKCEECGKGFNMQEMYSNHRARQHDPRMKHHCEVCSMRFKRDWMRQKHRDTHRFKFLCNGCDFISRSRDQVKMHHAMHAGKTFECQHCGKSFKKHTSYFNHLRVSHPGHNVACRECGETFLSDVGLKRHVKHTHKKRKYKCSTCSAKFTSVEALDRHTDTAGEHADLRPCKQCGENCASEAELQEHVKVKHPTESRHCEECDTTFSSAAAYDTHVRRKHLGQRPRYVYSYPRHVERTRRLRYGAVCDQCGHIARNSTVLEYHMRSHLAVKPFPCPHCPKTLETRYRLNYHIRLHTGEKPFQCKLCDRAFMAKNSLQRHVEGVHMGKKSECPICGRLLATPFVVKMHIRTVHNGEPWPERAPRKKKTQAKISTMLPQPSSS